ncbi:MAG: glycosyltransferase [Chloroflexi bacterium]|nr:glycosyltransferase [Chloroflexota bacterium]
MSRHLPRVTLYAITMRLCYFGAYNPTYPRNAVNREGLRRAGAEVVECRVGIELGTPARMAGLWRQYWRDVRRCDVIVVAEFSHTLVLFAWLIARMSGARLVFDPAVSLYEINVVARRTVSATSPRARYYWAVEWLALHLADLLVWYTEEDRAYFGAQYHLSESKSVAILPGVNTDLFRPLPGGTHEGFRVHFNGAFLPTHGVEIILGAADRLRDQVAIHFELIGDGQTRAEAVATAERLGLTNVTFPGRAPIGEIPARIAQADVCLGAFGDDPKLQRLFVLKAGQAMACRKPVITADAPATRRVCQHGTDIWLVPPGDPSALAEAILTLYRDPELRARLAEAGYHTIHSYFTPERIGENWLKALSQWP